MIKKHFETVKKILVKHPATRDNDRLLIALIWEREQRAYPSCPLFIDAFKVGLLTFPDTITRARRKVQQLHPELTGNRKGTRKVLQKLVRKEMADTVTWFKEDGEVIEGVEDV